MIDLLWQTVVQAVTTLALPTLIVCGLIGWSERNG